MKVKLGTVPLIYPIPIALVGAKVEDKANFTTVGDCGVMGIRPPLVFVSLNATHYTTQGILQQNTYSLNFPNQALLAITDYCGTVSGRDVDKSALFEVFYGELESAPLIEACPVNLECRVVKEFAILHRHIFVGEVMQTYIDEAFVTEQDGHKQIADLTHLDPIIYALDNRYYRIGEPVGTGYQEGKTFAQE